MVGVFIDTKVSDKYHFIRNSFSTILKGELDNSLRVPSLGTNSILLLGYTENNDTRDTDSSEFFDFIDKGTTGMLSDTGKRLYGLWRFYPLPNKKRGDKVINT
jgi:hypothetical protein